MTHGTISAWLKKPGDDMKAGDVLCDIETDKASVGFEVCNRSSGCMRRIERCLQESNKRSYDSLLCSPPL